MSKAKEPGWFDGAPISDGMLKHLIQVADDQRLSYVERLAAMIVGVVRYEADKELNRRRGAAGK